METIQQSFLSQIKSELTDPQVLIDLQLFAKSSWALINVLTRVLYLAFGQVFVWGQQLRIKVSPTLAQIQTKIYLAAKNVDNPITQFIADLAQPKVIDVISSDNLPTPPQLNDNSVFPLSQSSLIFPPNESVETQRKPISHTASN